MGRLRAQRWTPTDPEAVARYKKVAEERVVKGQAAPTQQRVRPVTNFPFPRSWEAAERSAALWLVRHGHSGARVTSGGADGGIDVVGPTVVGQVKHHGKPIGAPDIQRLAGAASAPRYRGRTRVFFSTRGFTPQALRAGQELGVQLFAHAGSDWRRVV
ncbi:restriction endonuclease [uncultured Kocuria sp.]|uniref:restriction endonuclease n=1 Tax=uncultured Kocuria sp. TaxID=259305 RepID=UPI003419063C